MEHSLCGTVDQNSSKMVLEDNQNETKHDDNEDKNSSDNNLKKISSKRPFPCKICHESFSTPISLSIHLKLHHPEENHLACNRCDEVMIGMTMWKRHVNEHIVVKPFKCTVCPSAFTETRSLNRHMTLHSQIKELVPDKSPDTQKYECGECCNAFIHKGKLMAHMTRVHKAKLSCPYCHKYFSKIRKLQIHMASKVYCKKLPKVETVSRICGKVITRTVNMDLYLKLHADDKPYMCRYCGERFAVPTKLKLHQLIHTGGKPFICECGKSYILKRSMQSHLKRCKDLKESQIILKEKKSIVKQVKNNKIEKDASHVEKLIVENKEPLQEPYKVRWKEEVDETTEFIYETYEPEKNLSKIKVEPLTYDPFDEPIIEQNIEPNESAELLIDPFDDPITEPKEEISDEITIEPKEELNDELCMEFDEEPSDQLTKDEPSYEVIRDEPSELTKEITIQPKKELNDELSFESDEEPSNQLTKEEPSDEFTYEELSELTKDELSDDLTVAPREEPNKKLTIEYKNKPIFESTDKSIVKKITSKKRGKMNKLANKVKCKIYQCGRSFPTKIILLKHLAYHTRAERFRFPCDVCPKKFDVKWRLQRHVKLIHGLHYKIIKKKECVLKCQACQDSFAGDDSLEVHVMEMHPELSIYPCKRCPSSFSNSLNLKKHVIKHHPDLNPLECNKCKHISGKFSNWKMHLITHLESEKKPKPFICDYCSRQFTEKGGLKNHLKTHIEFKCAVCWESFMDKISFRAHRKASKHYGRASSTNHICDACGQAYKNKAGLKIHLEKFHTPLESTCDVCGEKLFDKFQERVHQKRHIIPKPKKKPNNELTIKSKENSSTDKAFVKKNSDKKRGKANKLANKVKCEICDLQFCDRYIKTHMKRHKTKFVKCDQCDRSFVTKMKLLEHQHASHSPTERFPFFCDVCPKKFTIEWRLQRHMKLKHGQRCKIIKQKTFDLKCETCQESFDDEDSLEAHVMEMHPELSIYPCKRCPSSFSNSHNLNKHVIKHHPDLNPLECNKCKHISGKFSNWKVHLITHLESEKKPKPFICDYCSRQFTEKGGLKNHMKTHIEFKCAVCWESFMDKISFRAHRKASKHYGRASSTNHICDACGQGYKNKAGLKIHLEKFHTPLESTCDVCGEKLFDKFQERVHQKRHSMPKIKVNNDNTAVHRYKYICAAVTKIKCHKCGKILASKLNLKHHLRLHDNDKPCQCARCGKRFVNVGRLHLHAAVHFEEKPHVCQGCGRAFSQKGNLKAHLKLCRKFVDYSAKIIAIQSLNDARRLRTRKVVAHENITPHRTIIEPNLKQDEAIDGIVHKEDTLDVIAQTFDVEFKEETNDEPKNEVIESSPRNKTFEVGIDETYKLEITIDKDEASNDGSYFDPGEQHNSNAFEHSSSHNEDNETLKEVTKEEDEDSMNDTNVGPEVNLEDPLDESGEDTRRQEETSVVPVGSKPLTDKPDVNAVQQSLTCDVCDKLFKSRTTLKRHMKMHSEGKTHQCEKCGHAFHQKSNLKSHLRIHTGDKLGHIISRQSCPRRFPDIMRLNEHIKSTHNKLQPGERHVCLDCGKSYKEYKYLKIHMRNHTGERPYVCSVCGRGFTRSSKLNDHMRTHTNEGKVECDQCGKSCASKLSLYRHILTHGEKNHACHLCEKKYWRKDLLDTHLHRHSGIKPHKCKICEKSFAFANTLNRHMDVHADVQPQTCEICYKVFGLNRYLKKHMLIHMKSKQKKKT